MSLELPPLEFTKTYTLRDIVAVSGVSVPTAKGWVTLGVVVPDVADKGGRGRHRRFSFQNLVDARVVARFHNAGLTAPGLLKRIMLIVRLAPLKLSEQHFDTWMRLITPRNRRPTDRAWIVAGPDVVGFVSYHLTSDGTGPDVRNLGEIGYIVDLRQVLEAVEAATGDSWTSCAEEDEHEKLLSRLPEGSR